LLLQVEDTSDSQARQVELEGFRTCRSHATAEHARSPGCSAYRRSVT
jgi:hypothetical protein